MLCTQVCSLVTQQQQKKKTSMKTISAIYIAIWKIWENHSWNMQPIPKSIKAITFWFPLCWIPLQAKKSVKSASAIDSVFKSCTTAMMSVPQIVTCTVVKKRIWAQSKITTTMWALIVAVAVGKKEHFGAKWHLLVKKSSL